MYSSNFIPNAGRLPVLAATPVSLRQPVALLGQLPSIDSVTAEVVVKLMTATIMVNFKKGHVPDYKRALLCFRGLHPTRIDINKDHAYIMITVGQVAEA
jgi:hypothetical protein